MGVVLRMDGSVAAVEAGAACWEKLRAIESNLADATSRQAAACDRLAAGLQDFVDGCDQAVAKLLRFRRWQGDVADAMQLALTDPEAAAALHAQLSARLAADIAGR